MKKPLIWLPLRTLRRGLELSDETEKLLVEAMNRLETGDRDWYAVGRNSGPSVRFPSSGMGALINHDFALNPSGQNDVLSIQIRALVTAPPANALPSWWEIVSYNTPTFFSRAIAVDATTPAGSVCLLYEPCSTQNPVYVQYGAWQTYKLEVALGTGAAAAYLDGNLIAQVGGGGFALNVTGLQFGVFPTGVNTA